MIQHKILAKEEKNKMASNGKSPGMLLRNAGIFNPILVQAVGLCPVVAMATSVKSAVLLALISAVIITLSEFFASLLLKPVPRWVRIGIYIILGGIIVSPLMILIERTNAPLFGSLGIYLPIMAVNSLNVLRCERFAVKIPPLSALLDGITASVGYSAVLIISGLIREVLGSGSVFGFKFFDGHTLSGLLLPFGGFIVLGFAGAALRALIAKFWPKYLDKKQPKPGSKKKREVSHEPKVFVTPTPTDIPDFTADEALFSLDEISAESDESVEEITEIYAVEAAAEPEASEVAVHTENIEEPLQEDAGIPQQEETVAESEPITEAENEIEIEAEPEEEKAEENHTVFKELSLSDINSSEINTTNVSSFSENDDELEMLMNRSIGDILDKHKKEDTKE